MNANPMAAAIQGNLEEFTAILESGWSPPTDRFRINRTAGTTTTLAPNLSLWTEVIMRDWGPGLRVLNQYHPKITQSINNFNIALRNASVECASVFWDILNLSEKLEEDPENHIKWSQSVLASLTDPWSPDYEFKNTLAIATFLIGKGVRLNCVCPGEFRYNDLQLAGHSIWTRSVFAKRWECVHGLWPMNVHEWKDWPRLHETIFSLLDVVVGDYRSLLPEGEEPETQEEQAVLLKWFEQFASDWFKTGVVLSDQSVSLMLHHICVPKKNKIAPWFRWPLKIKNKEERQKIWNLWYRTMDEDPNKTWLHALSSDPKDPDVIKLIKLANADNAKVFKEFWAIATYSNPNNPSEGYSPHDVWEAMDGDIDLVRQWT